MSIIAIILYDIDIDGFNAMILLLFTSSDMYDTDIDGLEWEDSSARPT